MALIGDACYLPYEHGPAARQVYEGAQWLCSDANLRSPEWSARYEAFAALAHRFVALFERLTTMTDRDLLHTMYPYLWDIKGASHGIAHGDVGAGCVPDGARIRRRPRRRA